MPSSSRRIAGALLLLLGAAHGACPTTCNSASGDDTAFLRCCACAEGALTMGLVASDVEALCGAGSADADVGPLVARAA